MEKKRKLFDIFLKKKVPKEGNKDTSKMILVKDVNQSKLSILKPVLKWVGGKTQILDRLIADFPVEIQNYHEPFLGGGSVLFTLLSYARIGVIKIKGRVYASDVNEPLIHVYKNIQTSHKRLYDETQILIKEYRECSTEGVLNRTPENIVEATQLKENYYYWIRSKYNKLSVSEKNTVIGSAFLIFLNKTCFRGVFRIGPHGFNVPYGHSKITPEIINLGHLNDIHNLIKEVVFECRDFQSSLAQVNHASDFVYLDPPYAPETDTSFVKYTESGFCLENHLSLFSLLHELKTRNVKFMLSNADVKLVRDAFVGNAYHTDSILCRRSINSVNPESKAKEVIIKNY